METSLLHYQEHHTNQELYRDSSLYRLLSDQLRLGRKTPQIVNLDLDGTVYVKVWDQAQGAFIKIGDNKEATSLMEQYHIPFVINTARSGWDARATEELKQYGLNTPDEIVFGDGRCIMVKDHTGQLIRDKKYLQWVNDQEIQYTLNGQIVKEKYNPRNIAEVLRRELAEYVGDGSEPTRPITDIRIDNESDPEISYVTIDFHEADPEVIQRIVRIIHRNKGTATGISGVHVGIAEDINRLIDSTQESAADPDKPPFKTTVSGWLLVTPARCSKTNATRYIGNQIGSLLSQEDPNLRVQINSVGDASIDQMLLMGRKDTKDRTEPFTTHGWSLSNTTPLMKDSERKVEARTADPYQYSDDKLDRLHKLYATRKDLLDRLISASADISDDYQRLLTDTQRQLLEIAGRKGSPERENMRVANVLGRLKVLQERGVPPPRYTPLDVGGSMGVLQAVQSIVQLP